MDEEQNAHSVLVSYCKKNEDNPNAYRYLYEFQVRQGASDREIIRTLTVSAHSHLALCIVRKEGRKCFI